MKKSTWMFPGLAAVLSLMPFCAAAQDNYPARPVRLVVPFSPGGGADTIARPVVQKLSTQMSANVIIQNKDGAGGNVGAEYVAKSSPDGYTLLFLSPNPVVSAAFGEKLNYRLFDDLTPVASLASSSYYILAHPSVPANTPQEFADYLRSHQDKVSYGSSGTGGGGHLAVLMFLTLVKGAAPVHVPYKGGGQAHVDLLAGRIQFLVQSVSSSLPMIKQKRLKAIASGGLRRSDVLPEVPTISETLMPGFQLATWYGVLVPARTPPAIIRKLNGEIAKVLRDPDVRAQFSRVGAEAFESTPEQLAAHVKKEYERLAGVIKGAGLKSE